MQFEGTSLNHGSAVAPNIHVSVFVLLITSVTMYLSASLPNGYITQTTDK